jgi:hypothetical protein
MNRTLVIAPFSAATAFLPVPGAGFATARTVTWRRLWRCNRFMLKVRFRNKNLQQAYERKSR